MNDHVPPDETVLNTLVQIANLTMFQHNRATDLRIFDEAVVVDRRKRSNVGIDNAGFFADYGRTSDHAIDDLRSLLYRHTAIHLRVAVNVALDVR